MGPWLMCPVFLSFYRCVPQEGEWKALLSALDPEDRNSLRYDDLIKWADKAKDEEEGTGKGRKGEEDSGDERGGKGKAGGSYEGKRKAGLRADEVRSKRQRGTGTPTVYKRSGGCDDGTRIERGCVSCW